MPLFHDDVRIRNSLRFAKVATAILPLADYGNIRPLRASEQFGDNVFSFDSLNYHSKYFIALPGGITLKIV
jgi:hypothetical protein